MLPLEILDQIFGFVDDDDYQSLSTLEACSEIGCNPILLTAIDRRIYTHVEFYEWGKPNRFSYLSSNRHVANYIRTLQIYIHPNPSSQWYDQVSSILQMPLSSLERITLSYTLHIDATSRGPSKLKLAMWPEFPETFRKAFLDCLWSPNTIEVSIQRIGGFPLSIFNPCTQLKKLSLLRAKCIPSTSDAQFPPQLDSLVFDRSEDLATVISWAKTGHLRSLNLNFSFEDPDRPDQLAGYGQLIRLLDSSADTLTELELDFLSLKSSNFTLHNGRMEMNPPLALSHIRNLTQLTVSTWFGTRRRVLPAIISLVATSPSLERLILLPFLGVHNLDARVVTDFCKPLDLLVDHPSLKNVELRFTSFFTIEEGDGLLGDIIYSLRGTSKLRNLYDTGFLSVGGIEKRYDD